MKPYGKMLKSDRLRIICKKHDVNIEDLHNKCRKREYVTQRAIVAKELKSAGYLLERIADVLQCDHTTVMNLLKFTSYKKMEKPILAIVPKQRKSKDLPEWVWYGD